MLHHNKVVIKVAFGSVKKYAVRHSRLRWDLPLSIRVRDISGPSSDLDQEMHDHARVKS